MATVQQSIDIKVPVHRVYNQLMQFEAYPCFMEEVESVASPHNEDTARATGANVATGGSALDESGGIGTKR